MQSCAHVTQHTPIGSIATPPVMYGATTNTQQDENTVMLHQYHNRPGITALIIHCVTLMTIIQLYPFGICIGFSISYIANCIP